MAFILRNLKLSDLEALSVVDKGASGNAGLRPRIVLFKRTFGVQKENTMDMLQTILGKLSPEEQDYLKQLMAKAAPPPAEEPKPADAMAKALAALPADVRKLLEDAQAEKAEKAKAEEAEKEELRKRVAKMEDEREQEAFEKKAAAFDHLPGMSRTEFAKVLRSASKALTAEEFKKLQGCLKAAADAVKKGGLFKENGSEAGGDPAGAYEKIKSVAKSLREKDAALTEAQAISKAAELHPELVAEYQKERA